MTELENITKPVSIIKNFQLFDNNEVPIIYTKNQLKLFNYFFYFIQKKFLNKDNDITKITDIMVYDNINKTWILKNNQTFINIKIDQQEIV